MSLLNKLNRHKQQIVREVKEIKPVVKDDFYETWTQNGADIYTFEDQYCWIKEIRYSLNDQHGIYQLQEIFNAVKLWDDFEGNHPLSSKGLRADQLCFFDIETTGLHDGAGNTIFLIGYALIEEDEVVIRQHFLPEPGNEVALYHSFIERLHDKYLVTYNGKSFDWPRIKTQHTLVRDAVPKLPQIGHFDLYHASRRIWKEQLETVKLVNIESEILSIERIDDLPGFLAPMIYFDYVERKNPEGVLEILKHNERDILSLVTLYTHVTLQIHGKDDRQTEFERVQIAKWFKYIGEHELAVQSYEIGAGKEYELAQFELAYYYKRQKKYDDAKQLWEKAMTYNDQTIQKKSSIELAKLYEHQFKDMRQALIYAKQALSMHDENNQENRFLIDCEKRIQRLEIKIGKS